MNIISKKWWYFVLSGIVIVPGLISLVTYGLRASVDFTGGTLLELQIKNEPFDKTQGRQLKIKNEDLKKVFTDNKVEVGSIQQSGPDMYLVRAKEIDKNTVVKIENTVKAKYGNVKEERLETVGPTVGAETTRKAITAIIVASLAIICFIAWAFRTIPKPYSSLKFGICAVAALVHDVLVVTGIFSLLGHFYKVEVDSLFVTALLTIIGFSVHDTIVVFDRIRENLRKLSGLSFSEIVNDSILETLARSLSTTLTVLFTLFALLLFGGETIRWFVVALLIGIISGTYSSIFNAAPLLVVWEEMKGKRRK
ncbi:MAG: Protein translocase subunit SecF [Candidatus Gottesmanbacteria bacterium GW2011_GWC2_39_8]|uniref:Protein-export membrane protein SecF n=1 Tax=Candidatus Gottesmanbacteria bacterium GW2011_GWC2_39_8 TaxID=1618450 RepID=A0A0G0PRT6_9BACT|nr:MAG: Protein translocase subunit SecF [Candidatus Gottesmanbacteria bacterium GW2011_GWC2_39_8]